jgi:thiamine kinase
MNSHMTGSPPWALRHAVLAIGQVHKDATWFPLEGGRTNKIWHVIQPEMTGQESAGKIIKLFAKAADTPLFRNDPMAEIAILTRFSDKGLAPRLLNYGRIPEGAYLIYVYQGGHSWTVGTDRAARTLRAVHDLADPLPLPHAPDGSDDLTAQTLAMLDEIDDKRAGMLLARQPHRPVSPSGLRHLLHGDPVPGNFICPSGSAEADLVLIDWQCPALGDPVLDLAMFLSPAMQQIGRGKPLTETEKATFLSVYGNPDAQSRLSELLPYLHWRMAVYCLWKLTRERPDPLYAKGMELELAALDDLL